MYWVNLAIRLLMYLSVAVLGIWVYQRGVAQSLEDLGWIVGLLAGLGEAGERVGYEKAAGSAREARKISKGSSRWKTREAGW